MTTQRNTARFRRGTHASVLWGFGRLRLGRTGGVYLAVFSEVRAHEALDFAGPLDRYLRPPSIGRHGLTHRPVLMTDRHIPNAPKCRFFLTWDTRAAPRQGRGGGGEGGCRLNV